MLHARLQRAEAAPAARKFLLFSTSMVNKPGKGSLNMVKLKWPCGADLTRRV
jgi:hypothetical protein